MAHSVTGASLDGIYTRLNDAPQYHPLDAQTFADWTVEAGDVVRFQRGNVNYDSPVHSTKIVWRGTPQVTVSSTGTKEREPVSKVSRKKYGRGGNAVRSEERIYHEFTSADGLLHSAISISAAELTTAFENADAGLASQIQITAEQLTTNFEAADGQLSSRIIENATSISAEVSNRENADVELQGSLEILADKASLVVSATDTRQVKTYLRKSNFPETGSTSYLYYDLTDQKYYEWKNNQYVQTTPGNTINRAGIIATINNDGSSKTNILGDKIIIGELDDEDLDSWAADAKNGRGTFAKYLTVRTLTAQELNTMLADIGDATIDDLHVGTIDVEILTVEEGITVPSINDCLIGDFVADASISGTTLTLTDVEGETVTISKSLDGKTLTFTDSNGGSFDFNKATSLSGDWSGNTYTVTATPQGNTISVTPNIHHIVKDGTDNHILNTYIGTNSGGTWTNHGNAVKLYMVQNGTKVELNNINQPSSAGAGVVTYAEKALNETLEDKGTVYATGSKQTFTPSSGKYGISQIKVGAVTVSSVDSGVTLSGIPTNVIKSGVTIKVGDSGSTGRHVNVTGTYGAGNLMEESVYPSLYNQVVLPDPPYDGLSKVTIYAVQTANLNTYNIVKGVTVKIGRAGDDDCIASVAGSYVPTLSGNWSGNTYTVTATPEGSISVTPNIHHIVKDGTDDHILNTYIGTNSGGTWTNHGNVVKLYMVQNGSKVELNNINQPSSAGAGVVTYAEKALNDYWDAFDAGWQRYYDLWSATYDTPGDGTYSYLARSPIDHNDGNYTKVYSGVVPGSGGTTYYSRTMRCTSVQPTYPGSSTNYYYFRLEGNYRFSADTNYNMYRESWPAGD